MVTLHADEIRKKKLTENTGQPKRLQRRLVREQGLQRLEPRLRKLHNENFTELTG